MISIICPLYNKKDYIEETIQSVVNQTSGDWEMLIIDDGSSDGGDVIAQRWAVVEPRIKFLKRIDYNQEKKGGSVSRNIGIQKAQGEYLMFLDADDVLDINCLEYRKSVVKKNQDKNLIIFNHSYFKSNVRSAYSSVNSMPLKYRLIGADNNKELWLSLFLSYKLPWTISNPLWATAFMKRLGGFDESFQRLQDPELHTRALLNKTCNVLYLKNKVSPDVYIRMDESRHYAVFTNAFHKQKIYFDSVKNYITKFKKLLQSDDRSHLLAKLDGYIFSFSTNTYIGNLKNQYDTPEQIRQIEEILQMANNKNRVRRMYSLFKKALNYRISKKLKLPSVIYRMYFLLY